MASSTEKGDDAVGNGPSTAETLAKLGIALLTSLLPIATAHLAAWLEKRLSSSAKPVLVPNRTGPDAQQKSDTPPKLPTLENLP
jgi:hypothetical protein